MNRLFLILCSFICQLIQAHPTLSPYVYDELIGKGVTASTPTLLKILPGLLVGINNVRVVVDGLDEWDSAVGKRIIKELMALSQDNVPHGTSHKVLISSRDIPHIGRALLRTSILSLSEEKVVITAAIRSYVKAAIADLQDRFQVVETSIWDQIEAKVVEKSNGKAPFRRKYMLPLKGSSCVVPCLCIATKSADESPLFKSDGR